MDIEKFFTKSDLVPAIVVDLNNQPLMLAYMNRESLQLTLKTGYTWFWSRSRRELWNKGATSGNLQEVKEIFADCEDNSLLVRVNQTGSGSCHTGTYSCFFNKIYGD